MYMYMYVYVCICFSKYMHIRCRCWMRFCWWVQKMALFQNVNNICMHIYTYMYDNLYIYILFCREVSDWIGTEYSAIWPCQQCEYVCMCACCTYTNVYICICTYIYILCICTCIYIYVYMYIYICICIYMLFRRWVSVCRWLLKM